jgi:Domain of unknown function (DUF4224)
MTDPLFLTKEQLVELTDRHYSSLQEKALKHMKIPYRITPTGRIKVLLSDLPQVEKKEEKTPWQPKIVIDINHYERQEKQTSSPASRRLRSTA